MSLGKVWNAKFNPEICQSFWTQDDPSHLPKCQIHWKNFFTSISKSPALNATTAAPALKEESASSAKLKKWKCQNVSERWNCEKTSLDLAIPVEEKLSKPNCQSFRRSWITQFCLRQSKAERKLNKIKHFLLILLYKILR